LTVVFAANQNGKRRVVVVIRERGGSSVPGSVGKPAASFIRARIAGQIVDADEAASEDNVHERFEAKSINHQEAYSLDGACPDMAAEYLPHPRRAGIRFDDPAASPGLRDTQESSWCADDRRISNREQVSWATIWR
jgi:hypothetical protein